MYNNTKYEKKGSYMSKLFKNNIIFVIAVSITVLSSIILPLASYINHESLNSAGISSGISNVSKYDLSKGETVALSGEWEFYWGEHIISENAKVREPDLYVDIPSSWTTYEIDGQKLNNGGIASYRAQISGIKSTMPILVCVHNLPGACKVFIDGKCVFSNRSVPGANNVRPIVDTYTDPIVIKNPRTIHEIVVEVECALSSGLTVQPVLSTYNDHESSEMNDIAFRYVLIGIVAFFCVSATLLAFMQKEFDRQVWLIFLCVIFIFRMLITNEGYMVSQDLFFNVNYEIMTSLVFISTYIIKLCMMMYLIKILDLKVHPTTLVVIAVLFLLCAFVPYFLYDYIYIATTYTWLQGVAYLVDIYMIYKLSGAVALKKRFSLAYLAVYCINAFAIVIDNSYLNGFVSGHVSSIMPTACMIFIALMVLVHFIRVVDDFRKAQKAAELEKELSDINMTLMLSQIQPHFLYNALNTIKYLTKKDPKKAEESIVKFSSYLRANMDSLTQKEPISFIKELEHVRNYIDIEQLRFGERLNVEYDIKATNFSIPPLTIQPVVENAIKYGVNQKPSGGTVKISTYETDDEFVITVEDDGVGFDVNEKKDDGRSHVGIINIKRRLKTMLSAKVEIKSVINEGTTVKIRIPKREDTK